MKKLKKVSLFCMLIIFILLFIYICYIDSIPSSIILLQGEEIGLKPMLGLSIEVNAKESIETSFQEESEISDKIGKNELSLNLGNIKLKDISVTTIPNKVVVPGGEAIGLKLYTNGVLVVGMSEIEGEDNKKYKPYENSGIEEGDMITKISDKTVTCTADLITYVNECNGKEINLKYVRDGKEYETKINPTKTGEKDYKLGLWVRDAAAGVGTVSFYEPQTGSFAALGHGIIDIDTEEIIHIATGELVTSNIVSIVRGEKGKPGEIRGSIENGTTIGSVYKNSAFGIYGKLNRGTKFIKSNAKEMEILPRDEIQTGKAKIICTLENNKTEEYEIEIQKVFTNNNTDNKSMIIKVTDQKLIEKTGGIIQGMSGSPIIQNDRFVGAVTHVMVNDPTMGYGVFADMMLKQMSES